MRRSDYLPHDWGFAVVCITVFCVITIVALGEFRREVAATNQQGAQRQQKLAVALEAIDARLERLEAIKADVDRLSDKGAETAERLAALEVMADNTFKKVWVLYERTIDQQLLTDEVPTDAR